MINNRFKTEEEIQGIVDQHVADGFVFQGNVTLPDDEDSPVSCPNCLDHGLFVAWWQRGNIDFNVYRCYECGFNWWSEQADDAPTEQK